MEVTTALPEMRIYLLKTAKGERYGYYPCEDFLCVDRTELCGRKLEAVCSFRDPVKGQVYLHQPDRDHVMDEYDSRDVILDELFFEFWDVKFIDTSFETPNSATQAIPEAKIYLLDSFIVKHYGYVPSKDFQFLDAFRVRDLLFYAVLCFENTTGEPVEVSKSDHDHVMDDYIRIGAVMDTLIFDFYDVKFAYTLEGE